MIEAIEEAKNFEEIEQRLPMMQIQGK